MCGNWGRFTFRKKLTVFTGDAKFIQRLGHPLALFLTTGLSYACFSVSHNELLNFSKIFHERQETTHRRQGPDGGSDVVGKASEQ